MNKILKLLIDDFQNHKPSAKYQPVLNKVCETEMAFMSSLNKKQKAEYIKLDFVCGELSIVELRDLLSFFMKV